MAKRLLSTLALSLSALSYAAPQHAKHVPANKYTPTVEKSRASVTTLIPAVQWDHDFRDFKNLVPQEHSMLYFAETSGHQDERVSHKFLKLNATFGGPTVITEHSEFLSQIDCSTESLSITLSNAKAFGIAKQHWTAENLKFLTYSNGCGVSEDNSRTLWAASDVTFSRQGDGGVAHVKWSSSSKMVDGLVHGKIVWGTHHGRKRSTSSSSLRARGDASKAPSSYRCQPPRNGQGVDVTNWCKPNFDTRLDSIIGFKTVDEEPLLDALEAAAQNISGAVRSLEKRFHPTWDILDQDINLMLDNDEDSPFGPAHKIYYDSWDNGSGATASVGLYCQDCGINGHVEVVGEAEFGLFEGLVSIAVSARGNFHAGVKLALDAQAEYQTSYEHELLELDIGGIGVTGLVYVGPSLELDVELGFDAKAHGQIIAGAALDIGPFDAGFDLVSGEGHADNFEPNFSHTFDAHGEISVTAELKLPVKLGVGISIPLVSFDKKVVIVDAPGVKAEADFKISTDPSDGSACNGIDWHINLENEVYADYAGLGRSNLFNWESPPLGSGCIQIPGPSPPTTTQNPPPPPVTTQDPPPVTTQDPPPVTTQDPPPVTTQDPPPPDTTQNAPPPDTTNTPPTSTPNPPKTVKLSDGWKHNVYASPNGNLYLTPSSGLSTSFTDVSGTLVSDDAKRYLHFYRDVMDKFGVSRMRLSTLDKVPRTAGMIALEPVDTDNDGQADKYVAVDTDSNVFNIVVCQMIHQSPKIFLEKVSHEYSALFQKQLIWSVTGGEVTSCRELSLAAISS